MGFIAGEDATMSSAFQHGFVVPVKNGSEIQYEWIDPKLLSQQEPPLEPEENHKK